MRRSRPAPGLLCVVCLFGLLDARPAGAQANPDFDAVTWTPLTCAATPLTALDPRAEVDLVGDALFPAAYVGRYATYLYLRYRVELTPLSPRGFVRNSDWTMLVQVPAGNPFQYQYQLSLDGDDTVEVWKNDPADDLTFSPIFTDESDTLLFLHHHPGGTLPPHAAPGVRVHRPGGARRRGPRARGVPHQPPREPALPGARPRRRPAPGGRGERPRDAPGGQGVRAHHHGAQDLPQGPRLSVGISPANLRRRRPSPMLRAVSQRGAQWLSRRTRFGRRVSPPRSGGMRGGSRRSRRVCSSPPSSATPTGPPSRATTTTSPTPAAAASSRRSTRRSSSSRASPTLRRS